jgi:hypothetical protein
METEKKEFVEKRKGYFWAHIGDVFIGRQSRKVAFGVWGFIAANAFLADGKITPQLWWEVFLTCALLIGCGTIVDSILEKIGDKLAEKVAAKIKTGELNADTGLPQVAPQ